MPKTSGDELFERYLCDHQIDPGPHEPDLSHLGIVKRPDFLPRRGESRIACEVEQFAPGASKLEKRLATTRVGSFGSSEVYGPVRRRVASAAKQLKPLRDLDIPLVVVLANPDGAMVALTVEDVLAALFGNQTYVMPIDAALGSAVGEGRFEFGRDGKLTNDHAYVSAVALLRRREHRTDRVAELAAELRGGSVPTDFDTAKDMAIELLELLEQEELPEGDYLYLDVIETASPHAVPLPDEWFAGVNDTRWRLDVDGRFRQVRGPRRS